MILIAEDNVMIAMMMEDDLGDAGYQVAGPVSTADEALAIAREDRLTMALIDVDLLNGDSGIELATKLKAQYGLPCVFVTGQVKEAIDQSDAALAVLAKPFGPGTVVETVNAVLRNERPNIEQLTWFEREV